MSDVSTNLSDRLAQIGESRGSFMARVRAALGRKWTQPPREPAPVVEELLVRLAGADDDLPTLFTTRATGVGMHVHPVTQETFATTLIALLKDLAVHRLAVGAGSVGDALNLSAVLGEAGLEVVDWRTGQGLDVQYDLDAGITDVHAALAETGTLVCNAGARHSRGLSLVPRVHVAIVREGDILPDMIDYWARLKGLPHTELPSSQAFITGPSKTADIEGELITGVHGPECVHILLLSGA